MNFKEIPKKYRPIPFWSWNEKLCKDETVRQVNLMNDAGIGGYFMHARGGLQTEYMGDEWFENTSAAITEGNRLGMKPWAYDENGWPSGFGNGKVNELGIDYQQKYLRMSESEPKENVICKCGTHWFYFEVNPFYVDVLDKKVIKKFIEVAYKPYYEKFGNDFEGFFTDEPQVSRNGIPWSFIFSDEFNKRYSLDINEHLEELFLPVGDYKTTRVRFWKMVTELFSESFSKQIYDWCEDNGLKLTGHMVLEESMMSQLVSNGACMPQYEYFHIPGMDWLGRNIYNCLTMKQVSSVCEQLGKKQVLSETFALCGHNISLTELKGIFEWQMVHGINLLCQHLEGYSIRGMRKRDYPPAMYYQQPWWCEYKGFNDAMSRLGMILSEGEKTADVLLLHPMTSAWQMYDDSENAGIDELDQKLLKVVKTLEEKHILYHFGDEIIMERHAYVKDGKLIIGKQSYSTVVDPGCLVLLDKTKELLDEFKAQGGKVVSAEDVSENDVTNNPEITYTKRIFNGFNAHYFVNTSAVRKSADININGKMLDIYTGELLDFSGTHEFEPWGSLMIIEDGSKNVPCGNGSETLIKLGDELSFTSAPQNMLTLDRCDYYFDGVLEEKNGYVINICERANALERPVKIHQDYHFGVREIPSETYLVCETPDKFEIAVNGEKISYNSNDWVIDKSFKKADISKYLKQGENTISFDCNFTQNADVYECLKKAMQFETEKNKLVYDTEIESIYLLGDFSVATDGKWETLDKNAVRYHGDFVIDKPKNKISPKNIEKQGYPFFCGKAELEGEINIIGENPVLDLDMLGISTVAVEIGGIRKVMLTDNRLSLKDFGVSGKTKIKLTVTNNLRNLLGPHHLPEGESYCVCPFSFFKEKCVWNPDGCDDWNDGYCFCEMSI